MKPFIYALIDPLEPSRIRYVGMTIVNPNRPYEHIREARRTRKGRQRTHDTNWIQNLLAEGRKYTVIVLEEFEDDAPLDDVCEAERNFIALAIEQGHPLTNSTSGGECIPGGTLSDEHKARLSAAQKRRFENPAEREKIRAGHLGMKASDTTVAKQRASQKASWASGKRKAVSPDVNAAITRAQWADPVARAKKVQAIKEAEARKNPEQKRAAARAGGLASQANRRLRLAGGVK